jgi:hypothetical protein
MNSHNVKDVFINPYYAIHISPSLVAKHELMTSKEKWIRVNVKLIDDLGKEKWLGMLLDVLESGKAHLSTKKSM